jgi:hypothetical protein
MYMHGALYQRHHGRHTGTILGALHSRALMIMLDPSGSLQPITSASCFLGSNAISSSHLASLPLSHDSLLYPGLNTRSTTAWISSLSLSYHLSSGRGGLGTALPVLGMATVALEEAAAADEDAAAGAAGGGAAGMAGAAAGSGLGAFGNLAGPCSMLRSMAAASRRAVGQPAAAALLASFS